MPHAFCQRLPATIVTSASQQREVGLLDRLSKDGVNLSFIFKKCDVCNKMTIQTLVFVLEKVSLGLWKYLAMM